jgi:hypothetical protein
MRAGVITVGRAKVVIMVSGMYSEQRAPGPRLIFHITNRSPRKLCQDSELVPDHRNRYFEDMCIHAKSIDLEARFCECEDGWTGEFCDSLEMNSTEVNVTEYVDVHDYVEDDVAPMKEVGNGATFFAAGVVSRPPQDQTSFNSSG